MIKSLKANAFFGLPTKAKDEDSRVKKLGYFFRDLFLHKIYWPIGHFFRVYQERIGRSFSWAKFAWLNYDFDALFLYDVMEFKLNRVYKVLINGCAVQSPEDMKALKELIKICGRLGKDFYQDKHFSQHDKKWGKMSWERKPSLNKEGKPDGFTTLSRHNRPKVKTAKDKKKERKEFKDCIDNGEQDRCKDIARMTEILQKHSRNWWD